MKLTIDDLRKITLGAVNISEKNGKPVFHRFTEDEEILYKERDEELSRSFSDRCTAPAGINLNFKTNSRLLRICCEVKAATSRSYFSFDVFENGKFIGALDNFKEDELSEDYTTCEFTLGKFKKDFYLSEKTKEIAVYFPWSVFTQNLEIELDDGAFIEPIKPKKKMLIYGDSITQGYDALRPHKRYAARLAEALGAEEINKAIGGETFFPALAQQKADFLPDYVSVAYGTNDWSTTDGKDFYKDVKAFYKALSENYPDSKILAITPIWRANYQENKPFGDFLSVEKQIASAIEGLKNVTLISGFNLVSHNTKLFADLRLHPRDKGFDEYFENLLKEIGEEI
jgi:lysophospholipase L1-like esterase